MSATTLAAELAQALTDLEHLRLLVAERKVSAAGLAVAEYRVAGLRRRLADLQATDHPQQGEGGGGPREKSPPASGPPG